MNQAKTHPWPDQKTEFRHDQKKRVKKRQKGTRHTIESVETGATDEITPSRKKSKTPLILERQNPSMPITIPPLTTLSQATRGREKKTFQEDKGRNPAPERGTASKKKKHQKSGNRKRVSKSV